MGPVKFELNHAGIAQLLKSSGVQSDLAARAARIAAAARSGNDGRFLSEATIGRNRARATVWTADAKAMRAEAVDRALTRAVDAGR